jgi:hypothetical protein
MFWTIIIILTAIWLFGAVLAVAIMLVINLTILSKDPKYDCYSGKEMLFGFVASWATVVIVSQMIIDDL